MKRESGYLISVVGIFFMVIGFQIFDPGLEIFNIIGSKYISGIGVALVGIGVIVVLMNGSSKKRGKGGHDEVPIYEGTGRKRRIVGYRKD